MRRVYSAEEKIAVVTGKHTFKSGFNYLDDSQRTKHLSWQSSVRYRLTEGLNFAAHYTLGKTMAHSGGDAGTDAEFETAHPIQDFFCISCDWGCGITGCKKVAVLAEAFSKSCTPHNTSAHLGMAATVQLVASLPNARNPQEFTILPPEVGGIDLTQRRKVDFLSVDDRRKNDEQDVRQHLLTEPFRMVNSKLTVPMKPGLGIKLNPEIVKKHANVPVDAATLN